MKTITSVLALFFLVIATNHIYGDVNVMDYGAAGNGVTDDTAAITNAIANVKTNDTLFFPTGTYKINASIGLKLHSHMRVNLNGSTIFSPNYTGANCFIFKVPNLTPGSAIGEQTRNVKIYNGTLIGSKSGTANQFMGVFIDNGADVVLEDLVIKDCLWDGIMIGGDDYPEGSFNIRVRRCVVENAGRNAASLTTGANITYEDCVFRTTKAPPSAMPYAGIDIEPLGAQAVYGVTIRGCTFAGNDGSGVYAHGRIGDLTVMDCFFEGNKQDGLIVASLLNGVVMGNRILNHTNAARQGIAINTTTNLTVTGNLLENNTRGIFFNGGGVNVVIQGNTIIGTGLASVGDGITVSGQFTGSPPAPSQNDVTVSENIVAQHAYGIFPSTVKRLHVTGNKIVNNRLSGIITANLFDSLIAGNTIYSNGLAGVYNPLHVTASVTNDFVGNLFRSNTGATNIYIFGNGNANRVIYNDLGGSTLPNALGYTFTNFDNGGKNWNK